MKNLTDNDELVVIATHALLGQIGPTVVAVAVGRADGELDLEVFARRLSQDDREALEEALTIMVADDPNVRQAMLTEATPSSAHRVAPRGRLVFMRSGYRLAT